MLVGVKDIVDSVPNLFYILVSYNGEINDLSTTPDFWVIPSSKLSESNGHKISKNEKTVYISNKLIRENYNEYKNTFSSLEYYLTKY